MCTLIFYKLFGCWIICAKTASKYLKEQNARKREKREYDKKQLLKMQRNAKISATCLKGKESSHFISSIFRVDIWFFKKNIKAANLKPGWSTKFSCALKWFLCYFSNQQTDEAATQGCASNNVEEVEFSKNVSENQSNSSNLFFLSPFVNFVLFSMHCMIVECEY